MLNLQSAIQCALNICRRPWIHQSFFVNASNAQVFYHQTFYYTVDHVHIKTNQYTLIEQSILSHIPPNGTNLATHTYCAIRDEQLTSYLISRDIFFNPIRYLAVFNYHDNWHLS